MTTDDRQSHNAFERDKPGTPARDRAEAAIEDVRFRGGFFVNAVRATRMPMVLTDPTLPGNPIIFANEAFLDVSGYSMEEVLGQQPHFMDGAETDPKDAARFRQALDQDRDTVIETVQYRKNGSRFLASVFLSAFKDEDGRTLHQFLSYLDVTQREMAEDQLAASVLRGAAAADNEVQLRLLLEAQAMWETDADGVVIADSPSWRAYTGQALEEYLGYGWLDAVHPDDRAYAERQWRETTAARGLMNAEFRLRRPDGGWRWTNVRAVPMLDAKGMLDRWAAMNIDIDSHKRAEVALRESEARLRDFGEASQDLLWIRDAKTLQWQYLTPAFEDIYGQSREEALAGDNYRGWLKLIVPEDRAHAMENIERVKAGEQVAFEFRIRRPSDGAIRWLRNTDFPIRDDAGSFTLIGGIGHDFTELREAELRLHALIDGIPQLVWRADDPGLWNWASPQWTAFTGQDEADSHGWGWLKPLHPDDRDIAREAWSHAVERGGFQAEYRIGDREGVYRWFQTRAAPVRDKGGEIVEWLGTSTDIHELRLLQDRQQVMVQELQHRTRNLITVVNALSKQTLKNAASLSDFEHHFGDRLSALSRVQGLLSYLSAGKRVTFDELLGSELTALGAPEDKVTLDGPKGVPLRSAMVQTFSLALHELATNALKYGALATPDGHLTVRWGVTHSERDGPRLQVDWRETGVDMTHVGDRPRGGGYGRELIERALPYQLDAETSYEMAADGVHCTIDFPASTAALGVD